MAATPRRGPTASAPGFKNNWDNDEQQFIKKENNKYKKYNGIHALTFGE